MKFKMIIDRLKARNLHCILLMAILTIVVAMAAIPTVIAEVTWSAEAELYRDSVLPCVMDNIVKMGWASIFVRPAQVICVVVAGAENIAAGTDTVVDVDDLRAAMMACNYNQEIVAGGTLAAMCYTQNGLELGLFTSLPGRPPQVNCLEGTGISPIDCTALIAWMCANADAITTAMPSACAACGITWDPTRPISGAPECTSSYNLTIYSSPAGVTFTVDNVSRTTPWSGTYSYSASVSLVMPENHDEYVWSHWLEDGDPNRVKTVNMDTNVTLTGVYTRARIYLNPLDYTAQIGEVFTIAVEVSNVTNYYGCDFWLHYNDTIINCTNVDLWCDTVNPTGSQLFYVISHKLGDHPRYEPGVVKVSAVFIYGEGAVEFNGTGKVACLTFEGIAEGVSSLVFNLSWTMMIEIDYSTTPLNVKKMAMGPPVNGEIRVILPSAPPPVGGKETPTNIPTNKPELQTPWIWLAIILPTAVVLITVVYVKKRKRKR